jgi:putative SOS response-associated peptidase YedK
MCGRISQYRSQQAYATEIGWREYAESLQLPSIDVPAKPRFNVPPGIPVWLMHCLAGEGARIDPVFWGYRAAWAREKGLPLAINATIEKASSPYWRSLWRKGRAIVPADGWFEWTGEKGRKQPWHIQLKSGHPMFLAALTNFRPDAQTQDEGSGFTIVTTQAAGGMVDLHDRRPIVLSPQDALLWLDDAFPAEQAQQLARNMSLPVDMFEWFAVNPAVNKAGNDSPAFITPDPNANAAPPLPPTSDLPGLFDSDAGDAQDDS